MRNKGRFSGTLSGSVSVAILLLISTWSNPQAQPFLDAARCFGNLKDNIRHSAEDRRDRHLGKVDEQTAFCRGGEDAKANRDTPWVDWTHYHAAGDAGSKVGGYTPKTIVGKHLGANGRGVNGALLDLEYQRIELIKFNLFDNHTYADYLKPDGPTQRQWDAMRLAADHPHFEAVGGDGEQACSGELIQHRELTGICNDVFNPAMGSSGMSLGRNAQFQSTFPHEEHNELARNRHGGRLGLLKPDPQLISRKLFARQNDAADATCNDGMGLPAFDASAECSYQKAPFFNVLAAFWIQFMTHDWFSHLDEGRNSPRLDAAGCESDEAKALGCRPEDRFEPSLYGETDTPAEVSVDGQAQPARAYKTTRNRVTAWWDASQIYGHDDVSHARVIRDAADPAKLAQPNGYLPDIDECDGDCAIAPQWQGQESAAFPDNWSIGMSFYHNLFVREHNAFVDRFRQKQQTEPSADSGLRDPEDPDRLITYAEVDDERIFQVARLVVAAEIAKIHTIEWTPQLLYNEPLYQGINANWYGLIDTASKDLNSRILKRLLQPKKGVFDWLSGRVAEKEGHPANALFSVMASGAGIFGLRNGLNSSLGEDWSLGDLQQVNRGVNHFGAPFNFTEEFVSVYRLHPLLPDLIEFRDYLDPDDITFKIPLAATVRKDATGHMRDRGIENWALSMGRQRLGLLHLNNHPRFLQNLPMDHLGAGRKLDITALDIIRDRERGVPRFNEFRRQIGLKTLTGFDDFINRSAPAEVQAQQRQMAVKLREVYGTHVCDASKIISVVQTQDGTSGGEPINDCLGRADGTLVDNIEDLDTVVGIMAEYSRPHGFAISETQFHIFIINASRRLFSDRFFTSSFRPEFYSHLGYDWVISNGPLDECSVPPTKIVDRMACMEPETDNGHTVEQYPLKRLLARNVPELKQELQNAINAFDPWARDRGEYYDLSWVPQPRAAGDSAFE